MAIEDSAILAQCLARPGDPEALLRGFERRRWKRVAYAIYMARVPGMLARVSRERLLRPRDLALKAGIEGPMKRTQIGFLRPRV